MPAGGGEAREASRHAKLWSKRLIRLGYISRGVVYIIIGVVALQAVSGLGGAAEGPRRALGELIPQPFGKVLLGIVALGLLSYGLWRFAVGIADLEHNGRGLKGIVQRIGSAISGLLYAALFVVAVQLTFGLGKGGHNSPQDWTAAVLAVPLGRWAVGVTGAITVIVGLYNFYKAFTTSFRTELSSEKMTRTEERIVVAIGVLGFAAQGVVLCLIGIFLAQAALLYDPQQAGGVAKALRTLGQKPYGPWLLGAVAAGFIASGVYSLVLAQYRRTYL